MPNFGFRKDANGNSRIVQYDPVEVKHEEVVKPAAANSIKAKRFKCKVCDKKFAGQGVFSIHYNRNHLKTENKEEWRDNIETV